jgi:hypothetical protein
MTQKLHEESGARSLNAYELTQAFGRLVRFVDATPICAGATLLLLTFLVAQAIA